MYVARHFGVKRADEFLRLYGVDAMQAEPESVGEPYRTALLEARRIYEEKHFFHWDLEFPEVFIDLERATWKENPGFDAVVGNPPYGFVSDKAEQKVLSSTLYAISSYDSYVAFLERGIQTLSRSGFISYITPTSWQTGLGYRDFRDYVLRTCRVNQIVNLPYDIFPDAYIDTGIYVFRKECTFQKSNPFLNRGTNFFNFGKRDNAETKLSSDLAFSEVEMKQWVGDDQLRFVTDLGLLRLRQRFSTVPTISLGEFTISARGILPSGSDIAPERLGDEYRPFFDGDLFRYELILGTSKWVEYGTNLRELPSSYEFFQGKRVLIRRLISRQARIMAVYTETEFVTKKDIYSILISSGEVSLLAILSLLNSRLFSYWYLAQSMVATRDDFPQVTLADLRTLPIRQITFATSPETRRRAVEEAQRLYQDCKEAQFFDSDSCVHRLLDFVDRQLSQEPEQSDVVHDLLAYLAEKMIMMNRQKRAEVQGFLTWLELEVGAPLDELTNKTKIRGYLGDYQKSEDHLASEDLLDILHQNRRRLDVDPSARHFQNRLMQEYQASLEKLLPLKQRLTATDRLIDLVVYRLYGLTDEELAIVEGGNSAPPNPT
jgi:hypothetical protein